MAKDYYPIDKLSIPSHNELVHKKEKIEMPKIIPGLQEKILDNAQRLLFEEGYEALTVRKVASDCGIATGTFYNYYKSKDELVAHIMLRDWKQALQEMSVLAKGCHDLSRGLNGFVEIIHEFIRKYRATWVQAASSVSVDVGGYFLKYRQMLIEQVCEQLNLLLAVCSRADLSPISNLLAELIMAAGLHETITAEQIDFLAALLSRQVRLPET